MISIAAALIAAALFSIVILFVSGALASITSCVGQMFEFPFIDPWLARVDAAMGVSSESLVAAIATSPGFLSLLRWAYTSSIPLVIVSVIFPAAGAFEYLGTASRYGSSLPPGAGVYHLQTLHSLRASHQFIVNPSHLEGLVTFPSFHTAMALMTVAAWRGYRAVGMLMLGWNGFVVISTVPIGGHYVIDLLGGLASWLLVFRFGAPFAARLLDRRSAALPVFTSA